MEKPRNHLDKSRIEPQPIHFQTLRQFTPDAVSRRLPVVLLEDRMETAPVCHAFLHLDFMSVYVARQGTGVHKVEGVPFVVEAGDVYAMRAGMAHWFEASPDLVLDVVHFQPHLFPAEMLQVLSETEGLVPLFLGTTEGKVDRWLRLAPQDHTVVKEIMGDLRTEWTQDSPDRALIVQAGVLRLLVYLARCHHHARPTASPLIEQARRYIDVHYALPVRVQDLAASAFLSKSRFTELFRLEVGCTPRDYLGQVRIRVACELLSKKSLTVSEVAAKTGFPDPAYFTRFFRLQVGLSPTEYRESRLV